MEFRKLIRSPISRAIRSPITRPASSGVKLILDQITTASSAAYSLRQLRSAYLGSAIRVRRSSDSSEQDVSFLAGVVDSASALSFCYFDISRVWNTGVAVTGSGAAGLVQLNNGNVLLAGGVADKVYKSTDNGSTWDAGVAVGTAPSLRGICKLANGNVLVVGRSSGLVYKSTNNGSTWDAGTATPVTCHGIRQLANGSVLAGGSANGKIYKSTDNGATWDVGVQAAGVTAAVTDIIQLANGSVLVSDYTNNKVFKSTDNGATWDAGVTITGAFGTSALTQITNGTVLAASFVTSLVYRSTDNGATWDAGTLVETGAAIFGMTLLANGNVLSTGFTTEKVYLSASQGFIKTWYDQSANGYHATQTVNASQPQIVVNGAINLENSKPALDASGTAKWLFNSAVSADASLWTTSAQTMNFVARSAVTSDRDGFSLLGGTASTTNLRSLGGSAGGGLWRYTTGSDLTDGVIQGSTYSIATGRYAASANSLRTNGVQRTTGSGAENSTAGNLTIGARDSTGGTPWLGVIGECILFNTSLSDADALTLERNQGLYYGITTA